MENTCFICGVERFTLDTKGGGFERHTESDHNMWKYLFMLSYLWTKDPNDYNGWEQYVSELVKVGNVSFLPRNIAIVLRDHLLADEAEGHKVRARAGSPRQWSHQSLLNLLNLLIDC